MVSRRMSVRTADCERADCKTQAPDITCGHLDSSLLGARRAPCKIFLRSIPGSWEVLSATVMITVLGEVGV